MNYFGVIVLDILTCLDLFFKSVLTKVQYTAGHRLQTTNERNLKCLCQR